MTDHACDNCSGVDPASCLNAPVSEDPLRSRLAAKLREVIDYQLIAEWICCAPVDPAHDLCRQGDTARKALGPVLADDPEYAPSRLVVDALLAEVSPVLEQLRASHLSEIESLQRTADLCREKDWAELARLRAELGARTTTVALLRAAHKDVCEERDQALVNEETAKGWRDTAHRERDEARREAADYRRENALLQEINTIRTGERDRFKDTLTRIRAAHHLGTEWVSLSEVCIKHAPLRVEEPNAASILIADACPDCRPSRYLVCVCGDHECPVIPLLDQPEEGQ